MLSSQFPEFSFSQDLKSCNNMLIFAQNTQPQSNFDEQLQTVNKRLTSIFDESTPFEDDTFNGSEFSSNPSNTSAKKRHIEFSSIAADEYEYEDAADDDDDDYSNMENDIDRFFATENNIITTSKPIASKSLDLNIVKDANKLAFEQLCNTDMYKATEQEEQDAVFAAAAEQVKDEHKHEINHIKQQLVEGYMRHKAENGTQTVRNLAGPGTTDISFFLVANRLKGCDETLICANNYVSLGMRMTSGRCDLQKTHGISPFTFDIQCLDEHVVIRFEPSITVEDICKLIMAIPEA